jgi:chloramphenicol 3-O phosphotransferase
VAFGRGPGWPRLLRDRARPDPLPGDVRAAPGHLDAGLNVIADDVVWKRDWLVDMVRLFEGRHVTVVAVRVPEAEGARREILRGERHAGWNRGSARAADADAIYDIEIDTTHTPPKILAQQLVDWIRTSPTPIAFARLRERFEREP